MEDRLTKFAKLVDIGSFTAAAGSLHLSQPALSTAIAKLEKELHTTLLVRGSRSLKLTEAGRIAYDAAKELTVHTENLQTRLSLLNNEELSLSIGMIDSVA